MTNYSPVVIPTLNRHKHFKRCIESLAACTHAADTDLYIFLDFPLKDSHKEGYEIINDYLPTIIGFKTVNIIKREKNFGVSENFHQSLDYVFNRYDSLIFSEDDNVFAQNFLEYINNGLDKYQNDSMVSAICGYNYAMEIPLNYHKNHYFSHGFSAWGFGIWKTRYMAVDKNISNLRKFLYNPFNVIKLNAIQYDLFLGLINIAKCGKITYDRIFAFNNIKNDTLSVFPSISKVRNLGHDGTGVHCSDMVESNIFHNQVIDEMRLFTYDNIDPKVNNDIYRALRKHNYEFTHLTYEKKIRILLTYIIFLISSTLVNSKGVK